MIPFSHTWPYELIMKDIYISECPFCHQSNVLMPIKPKEIKEIHEGKKKLLVFPCCYNKVTVIDTDSDYLLTDTTLRNR